MIIIFVLRHVAFIFKLSTFLKSYKFVWMDIIILSILFKIILIKFSIIIEKTQDDC